MCWYQYCQILYGSDNIPFYGWWKNFNGRLYFSVWGFSDMLVLELDGDRCLSMVQEFGWAKQCGTGGAVFAPGHQHWHSYAAILWCCATMGTSDRRAGTNRPHRCTSRQRWPLFSLTLIQEMLGFFLPRVCPCISSGTSVTWLVNKFTEMPCQLGT